MPIRIFSRFSSLAPLLLLFKATTVSSFILRTGITNLQSLNFHNSMNWKILANDFSFPGLIYRLSFQLLERLLARNDLTEEEAEASLNFLLSSGSEALISSFLVLMRTKGETSEEVGFFFLFVFFGCVFCFIILDLLYNTKE